MRQVGDDLVEDRFLVHRGAVPSVERVELHRTLWDGADNQMLRRIWPLVESPIRMATSLDQATRADLARDAELHGRLVDVIASGDQQQIATEVREHIARSADEVVKLIERNPDWEIVVASRRVRARPLRPCPHG